MDKIFIKERLYVVDYDNNNLGMLYTSQGSIDGAAYNINLQSDVAGWHDLSFEIPAYIIVDGVKQINPITSKVGALSKIKYEREVKVNSEIETEILYFIIQPEDNTRADGGVVNYSYKAIDYPRHVLSKTKQGLTITAETLSEKYSLNKNNEVQDIPGLAIYIKAEPQTNDLPFDTLNDVYSWAEALPGAIAEVVNDGLNNGLYRLIGTDFKLSTNWIKIKTGDPIDGVWNPNWQGYPLAPDLTDTNIYYGNEPTDVYFYWDLWFPDSTSDYGRFEGVLYKNGDRLIYDIYESSDLIYPDTYLGIRYDITELENDESSYLANSTVYILSTKTVWKYIDLEWKDQKISREDYFPMSQVLKGDWGKLQKSEPVLSSNNAYNYLSYILENTGWSVGIVDKIMVESGLTKVDPEGKPLSPDLIELVSSFEISDSNVYNAISELSTLFKLYPKFDHVNKTISLYAMPGEDNGLFFRWRENLKSASVTKDGEKVITKLWVYGGDDDKGTITISDCNRRNQTKYKGSFTGSIELNSAYAGSELEVDDYAQVVSQYTWQQLTSKIYNLYPEPLPITGDFLSGQSVIRSWGTGKIPQVDKISNLPESGELGEAYYVIETKTIYVAIIHNYQGFDVCTWYDTNLSLIPSDLSTVFEVKTLYTWAGSEWLNKDEYYEYYETLSPFADNYILNFDYFLSKGLITNEQIDDIKYNYILPISKWNKKIWPKYNQYLKTYQYLLDAQSTYDAASIAKDAIDKAIRTTYTIYENPKTVDRKIKETIYALPPGANKNVIGWMKTSLDYATTQATIYSTYASLPGSSTIGTLAKIEEDLSVYMYISPYSYDNTITNYLGWEEGDVVNPSLMENYLYSTEPTPLLEAKQSKEGLFEKYREELTETGQASLSPWYNPPVAVNLITEAQADSPVVSSLGNDYFAALLRLNQLEMEKDEYQIRIANLESEANRLLDEVQRLTEKVSEIEGALKVAYGDFIIEGVYTNDAQVYPYPLWDEGMKAMQLYSYPLVTYNMGVVDLSGLPEYRTTTQDIYHDIVYRMNDKKLVLPNPGDFVTITDETIGLINIKANITTINRNISNPAGNAITIKTVTTNTEDMISSMISAANVIMNKESIYNRAAYINKDGTIFTDSIANTTDNPNANITILGRNGTVRLEGNGIIAVDQDDPYKRIQMTGTGIYSTTNGGNTWNQIISDGQVATKSLSAGTIDSNTISISSKNSSGSIVIDGKGITAKAINTDTLGNKIPETTFFLNSKTGDAYFKGEIEAGSGHIGGWKITSNKIYGGDASTGVAAMQIPSATTTHVFAAGGTSHDNYIDSPFRVTKDGSLYATKATITGSITATDGGIGGWNIDSSQIQKLVGDRYSFEIRSDRASNEPALLVWDTQTSLYNFYVRPDGYLYARNADVTGSINTSSLSCTGGYLSIVNTGWLSIGRVSNHPILSGLNLDVNGGISFRSGTGVTNAGTGVASINSSSSGGITYGSGSGNHIFNAGNVEIQFDLYVKGKDIFTGVDAANSDGTVRANLFIGPGDVTMQNINYPNSYFRAESTGNLTIRGTTVSIRTNLIQVHDGTNYVATYTGPKTIGGITLWFRNGLLLN